MWHFEASNIKNWDRKLSGRIIFTLMFTLYKIYIHFLATWKYYLQGRLCQISYWHFWILFYRYNICVFIYTQNIFYVNISNANQSSLDIHHYLATEYVWATKFRLILFFLFFFWDNSALHVLFLVNDIIGKFNPRVN